MAGPDVFARFLGQMVLEAVVEGLDSQGFPVNKEQDALRPFCPEHNIYKRHGCPCFTSTSRHYQQEFPVVFHKARRNWCGQQVVPVLVLKAYAFKIIAGEKTMYHCFRRKFPVPEPCFIAIGQKDKGGNTKGLFYSIGIISGLLFACNWVAAGFLGFNNGKWVAVTVEKQIIDKSGSWGWTPYPFFPSPGNL